MADDLAGSETYGPQNITPIFAGEADIITDGAVALADITKYQLIAVTTTGVTPFVVGTHTADQAAVAMQAATSGESCPFATGGYFNHEIIGWPADATLDTYAERRAFLVNATLKIGRIRPAMSTS